jgi:hypothetical protein
MKAHGIEATNKGLRIDHCANPRFVRRILPWVLTIRLHNNATIGIAASGSPLIANSAIYVEPPPKPAIAYSQATHRNRIGKSADIVFV